MDLRTRKCLLCSKQCIAAHVLAIDSSGGTIFGRKCGTQKGAFLDRLEFYRPLFHTTTPLLFSSNPKIGGGVSVDNSDGVAIRNISVVEPGEVGTESEMDWSIGRACSNGKRLQTSRRPTKNTFSLPPPSTIFGLLFHSSVPFLNILTLAPGRRGSRRWSRSPGASVCQMDIYKEGFTVDADSVGGICGGVMRPALDDEGNALMLGLDAVGRDVEDYRVPRCVCF